MNKRKICLFVAHSPLTGGGGVILRSLVKYLPEFSISWYYVADKPISGYEGGHLGKALMGGPYLQDIWHTFKMLVGFKTTYINKLVNKLVAIDCDEYWIVSHNEGLRVAFELSRRQARPVHLTVHDDWAGALCARSVRYRLMSLPARRLTVKTLKSVSSFDVVSMGMQRYYKQLSGMEGKICHRYLPESAVKAHPLENTNPNVTAGHIGSIYSKKDFIVFLMAFAEFFSSKDQTPLLKVWGCHLNINDIPNDLRPYVVFYPTLSEEEVIPLLSSCLFLYAMYPLSSALSIFSQTSLPTKLSSYLQAGRPILGHGPKDSSLAEYLHTSGTGVMWTSNSMDDGFEALKQVIVMEPGNGQLQNTRSKYFGENNLLAMRQALNAQNENLRA